MRAAGLLGQAYTLGQCFIRQQLAEGVLGAVAQLVQGCLTRFHASDRPRGGFDARGQHLLGPVAPPAGQGNVVAQARQGTLEGRGRGGASGSLKYVSYTIAPIFLMHPRSLKLLGH